MDKREFNGQSGSGEFIPNAVASTTSHRKGFSGNVGLDLQDVRPEDFLKTWMQGPEYMRFYGQIPVELKDFFDSTYTSSREYEYLIIGRKRRYDRFI
jgi:hypothetical protein